MFGVAAVVIATWVSDDQTIADVRVNQESAGSVKDTVRMRKHEEMSYKNQNSTEYRIKNMAPSRSCQDRRSAVH